MTGYNAIIFILTIRHFIDCLKKIRYPYAKNHISSTFLIPAQFIAILPDKIILVSLPDRAGV